LATVTSTGPAGCAGVSPVIVVVPMTWTLVAASESNVTVVSGVNPVPVIVNADPPPAGPAGGSMLVIESGSGTSEKMNPPARRAFRTARRDS